MLPTLADYERLVYSLPDRYPSIQQSTLVIVRHGSTFAELTGVLESEGGIRLAVWEDLNFSSRRIQGYSYEVSRRGERLYWYDPQPHPNDPSLASSFPHHRHVPPDIKHHRVPALGISFEAPNLPVLVEEIMQNLL